MQKALIYADKTFDTPDAKTAHGLVRMCRRYDVRGVVDSNLAGKDAGAVLDGRHRDIPIYASVEDALAAEPFDTLIVGIATIGGRIDATLKKALLNGLSLGLDVVSGLHSFLTDDPDFISAAKTHQRHLFDVRKPKPRTELHAWSGKITEISVPRVAVLGTDCALGKRTTTRMLTDAATDAGLNAHMISTGQTGWLQGDSFGFILDSVPNDFVCGELEHATLACVDKYAPEIILFEGQSSLRNPCGPCGAEFLLSGGAKYVILQTAPTREFFDGYEDYKLRQPSLKSEIELIGMYGAQVIAISLNSENANDQEMRAFQATIQSETGIPTFVPLLDGMAPVLPILKDIVLAHKSSGQ